jgi:tetratricopeptide (TPR) repeat protein
LAAETASESVQSGPATGAMRPSLSRWLLPAIIFLLTAAAFLPTLQNGFVDWDDGAALVENPHYRGLGWEQLRWMFTSFQLGHYQPLTWVSFGLDYLLWGMDPFGYHLTNLLLHAVNALLFYFLSLRLLSLAASGPVASGDVARRVAAGFAALLFAVHPLRVESVAWATERRDVLSGLFWLLTLLAYLKAATGERKGKWLAAALVAYVFSLLSKAVGITLPFVLLALDVYPLRRLGGGAGSWFGRDARSVWREKILFLLPAIGTAAAALIAQHDAGALKSLEAHGIGPRLAQIFFGAVFYAWKTAIPAGLSPLYELPTRFTPCDWPFAMSAAAVVVISGALFAARRRWPAALTAWVCYLIILAPVLGIAQSGDQLVADRYTYLSCLGWALLGGAGLLYCWHARVRKQMGRLTFLACLGLAGAVVIVLGALTWKQVKVWRDSESLWAQAVAVDPQAPYARMKLAVAQGRQGKTQEALEQYRLGLQMKRSAARPDTTFESVPADQGELRQTIQELRRAIELFPLDADAHFSLGKVLTKTGHYEEAIEHFRQALRVRPGLADAHAGLSEALEQDALRHREEASRIRNARSETQPQP